MASVRTAARAADLRVDVVAPSKTPWAAADRVKTNPKDAELLVRLLLAGSLTPVAVPSPAFEAVRDLGPGNARSCAPIRPPAFTACRSSCSATGARMRAAAPGRGRTDAGW